MKKIKYQYMADGSLYSAEVDWSETNEEIVKAEAYNGEYEIFDDGQPTPQPESGAEVWDELDAAYQSGYDEGYTEGVNTAYDQ